jgi:hypothetical protein
MSIAALDPTIPRVLNVLIMDSEGKRIAVKYYSPEWCVVVCVFFPSPRPCTSLCVALSLPLARAAC